MDSGRQKSISYGEIALLIGILLLAAVLRMGQPGLVEFKRDEALLLSRALDVAQGQQFHLRGISSSVGFPNTPMSVWFFALPLLVWDHVYAGILFTGILNTAAVLGCWWLVRRYWGPTSALAAALLFAVSPWAVFHSQKIWAQNLLVPLVMVWAITAALAFVERKAWTIILHLLSLAIAIQVHFAAVALVPASIIYLIVFRRRVSWRLVILGGFLALLTAIPFAYYLFFGSNASLSASGTLSTSGFFRSFDLSAWRYIWLLTTGREIHALAGPTAFETFLATVPDLTVVHLLWIALVVGGLVWLGREATRYWGQGDKPSEVGLIVLIWLFVPVLFYTIPWLPVELHYLLPAYPAQYIAAGVAFGVIASFLGRWRPIAWGILGLSAVAQVWVWLSLMNFLGNQFTPGGYGTPVKYHLQAADQARQMLAETGGSEILIAGQSENPQEDEFAAVFDVLLRDIPRRFVDLNRSALFPGQTAVAVIDNQADNPAANTYLAAAGQVRQIDLRGGEGALKILSLPDEAEPSPEVRLDPSLLYANWVNLYGYDQPKPLDEGKVSWRIYWDSGANPDPLEYHFFNHLIDASGQRVGQEDAAVFSPQQWREGDTVVSFFTLPWPAGAEAPLTMRTGIYRYPSLENVPVMDVAGNPASDAAELPLVPARE
jgi:4-amino-4-deoxy-L-arabinose transferase-like glycosyltransferase